MNIHVVSRFNQAKARLLICQKTKTTKVYSNDVSFKNECFQLHENGVWDFEEGSSYDWVSPSDHGNSSQRILAISLGKEKTELKGDVLRKLGHKILKTFRSVTSFQVDLSQGLELANAIGITHEEVIQFLAEGFFLAEYQFDKYLRTTEKKDHSIDFFTQEKSAKKIIEYAQLSCEGTLWARDLLNEPGNKLRPPDLTKWAKTEGKKHKVKTTVFGKSQLTKLGMGGILGVNQGSDIEPQLIQCEYRPKTFKKTLLLIGKGVTFDTGGYNLKPYVSLGKMGSMKMDMGGAAVTLSTIMTAARLQLPTRIIALVPAVENMISGSAMRPGDVITMYDGTTVEVDNTDAEGRLILADALAYGIKKFKPDLTIDLATLTGACVIALGHQAAAMYSTTDAITEKLLHSGQKTAERVWPMPLFSEYHEQLKSKVADMMNVGGKAAGSITAAKFLQHFTQDTPWVHLDIAGTAMLESSVGYWPAGGTGYGVRLLIDFIQQSFHD